MIYIVCSGDGFFLSFEGNTPKMDSDPVCGTRMAINIARSVKDKLDSLGFDAYIIPVRIGKINYTSEA